MIIGIKFKEVISYMPTETLYDIALQYKKTKLWKQLCDTELFALKLSNGEIGYCSVMGRAGRTYRACGIRRS